MRAILLVDHGSRVRSANAQLEEVAGLVARQLGGRGLVGVAHMELASPSIGEGLAALAAQGASEIVVMPYFLTPGRHATEDVPRLAREAARGHAGVKVTIASPLGVHELLARLVVCRCEEALGAKPPGS